MEGRGSWRLPLCSRFTSTQQLLGNSAGKRQHVSPRLHPWLHRPRRMAQCGMAQHCPSPPHGTSTCPQPPAAPTQDAKTLPPSRAPPSPLPRVAGQGSPALCTSGARWLGCDCTERLEGKLRHRAATLTGGSETRARLRGQEGPGTSCCTAHPARLQKTCPSSNPLARTGAALAQSELLILA